MARVLRWCIGAVFVFGVAGCGGSAGPASPEQEVKGTLADFTDAVIDGENGKACAMTTDVETCLGALVLTHGFLGEGGYEAILGDDWREQLENARVEFTDADHASIPPLGSDDDPTEFVREGDRWLIVMEE